MRSGIASRRRSTPLWIAFALVRRGRTRRFTYGYGRAEDVAGGVIIVALIFVSACVARVMLRERSLS